ncbi:hypothetical protein [Streptomyces antibioticus]|uniref:hypothetical protein n=1 Tax=Streptomyces antibioticus TaxID=1890 RepID=UPI0033F8AC46
MGVGLLAAATLLAVDLGMGAAAVAAPSVAATQGVSQGGILVHHRLHNLVEGTQPTFRGSVDVLKLAGEPAVAEAGGGVYYVYDPDTERVGYFLVEGDIAEESVTDWRQAQILPPGSGTREIRYGDVDQPGSGSVVAKATAVRYQVDNLVEGTQPTFRGSVDVLKLAGEPAVAEAGGGVYYVYDPDTERVGYFLVEGDIAEESVTDWRQAQILPPGSGTREIRYGDVDQPGSGSVVAKAVVL